MPRCYLVKKNAARLSEEVEEGERKSPGPKSPTEATTAPNSPHYYRNLDKSITMANGYDYIPHNSQDTTVIRRAPIVASHDGGIPIFRERSAEETEAAHDLLELSRSLPPLQNPVVVRVTPKYDEEKKFSGYESPGEGTNSKPHIPVSVVVRVPSCVQTKSRFEKSSILPLESPPYEGPSVICEGQKSEKRLSEEYFPYGEKPVPSLLPLSYREELISSVICDPEKRLSDEEEMIYEETYDQNLSSGDKTYQIAYEEDPIVIAMSSPRSEVISRPVPTKVISVPPDPSVPPHVVQFSHIVTNASYHPEERGQTSVIEPVYPATSASLPAYPDADPGTNFVSHTPVIRFQPSSESSATEYDKPMPSEYHSDAENNNPNPNNNSKSALVRKKRLRASFLPTDWKRKKTNPSDDSEHSGKRKYSCTQCGKKYATSSNLSRHKQTHRSLDSQSAKKCMTCGKAYVSMPALAMHLLTHKLSHACGICGKMFSRPWLLQGHLRSHTGEKPYRCGHCGKAFADRSNLRAHMQTHSFEKNYICLKCKKSFALKSYLSKHLESSCLKENNDIELKSGMESPTNSMDPIDVETWSKDGDADDPGALETDESMDEIVVV